MRNILVSGAVVGVLGICAALALTQGWNLAAKTFAEGQADRDEDHEN